MTVIIDGTAGITFPSGSGTQAAQSKVLQVVNATTSTSTSNTTTTFSDTTLTATITPLFATSKILVIAAVNGIEKGSGNSGNACALKLVRNSTDLITFNRYAGYTNSLLGLIVPSGVTNYLDSPATTSATTYKCQFKNEVAASYVYVQANNDVSTITLMEIAA
jgi:hypothetical protein